MIKLKYIVITTLTLSASFSFAAISEFKGDAGKVNFLAIGNPSALKIKGTGEGPSGTLDINGKSASGELSFKLDTLDTGIDMRTKHMKEKYLQTSEYPTATLKISKFQVAQDLSQGDYSLDKVPFEGTLQLHGVEHTVTGTADLSKKDSKIKVTAAFKINIEDYKIDIPSFAGIKVANDVDIDIESIVNLQ